jgi:hypothetical protein
LTVAEGGGFRVERGVALGIGKKRLRFVDCKRELLEKICFIFFTFFGPEVFEEERSMHLVIG